MWPFAPQNCIEDQRVDDDSCDREWSQTDQAEAEGKQRAENHEGPIDDDTTDKQDDTRGRLARQEPADAEDAEERKNNLQQ